MVEISEVFGCDGINGTQHKIRVLDAFRFAIGDTSALSPYIRGGIARQVKVPVSVAFEPLSVALKMARPKFLDLDFSLPDRAQQLHLGFRAIDLFAERNKDKAPARARAQAQVFPRPWNQDDAEQFLHLCSELNSDLAAPASRDFSLHLDVDTLRKMAYTAQGCLGALCATLAGVVGQEVLKAVTGKFTPLNQFLYVDAADSVPEWSPSISSAMESPNTMSAVRGDLTAICLGPETVAKLADLKVFMVGAGAIGCEMLKNLAVLGVSCGENGMVAVTDHDNIEMSNLNRQFLFRREDIQRSKAEAAVGAVQRMQPLFHAEPMLHKVEAATETIFTDGFFERQNVVINALDNVEAREYVDGRCVSNQRPLLESGTMGTKGHVQVILPFLTESYTSQSDPQQNDVPYCTIKNFPAKIEHTILWARDKFESLFSLKPAQIQKFIDEHGQPDLASAAASIAGMSDGAVSQHYTVYRSLTRRPTTFDDCVSFARQKFEKMFNHSIRQLLHSFPLDMMLSDGVTPYWTLPKRPPTPIDFNVDDPLHLAFVESAACLRAESFSVPIPAATATATRAAVLAVLPKVVVPAFKPNKGKKIVDDESKTKEDLEKEMEEDAGDADADTKEVDRDVMSAMLNAMHSEMQSGGMKAIRPVQFEKDDDSNHHIDVITAAANLRARNYGIAETEATRVKLIAGRIIPAIATTTSVISGLVTLELIKIVRGAPLTEFRNAFVNLALPIFALSEPGAAVRHSVLELGSGSGSGSGSVSFTLWDRWEVSGLGADATLNDVVAHFRSKYGLDVDSVFKKTAAIYMPAFPGHGKRLKKKMVELLKHKTNKMPYYDLVVVFNDPATGEEVDTPGVRYYV